MSLYPLPAVLFLLSLIVLLVILALVYVFVLRKSNICGGMEGHAGDEEEGKEPSANGGDGGGGSTGEIAPENTYGEAGPGGGNTENIDGGDLTDAPPPQEPVLDSKKPAGGVANTEGDNESKAPAEGTTPTAEGGVVAEEGEGDVIPASEEEPLSIGGKILVQFTYKPAANKINLTIIRAGEMPPPERGGAETIRVHLCILPQRKQRFRTKAVPTSKGVFNETFEFIHMTQDVVENCAIRLRVYGTQRFSKRIIGEVRMPLSQVDLTSALSDEQIWKTLSPKGLVDEEIPSAKSKKGDGGDDMGGDGGGDGRVEALSIAKSLSQVTFAPELLINFHYQDLTGRLHVELIRGANLQTELIPIPNIFVKIKVISGKGKKIGKSATAVHYQNTDPEFNETFVYPMSPIDLKEATMMFTVYMCGKQRKKKRTLLGWFAYGQNTSGSRETAHWKEMIENPDCDIMQWQSLQTA